jgi:hypothetical protein
MLVVAAPLALFLVIGLTARKFDNRTRLLIGIVLVLVLVLVYKY